MTTVLASDCCLLLCCIYIVVMESSSTLVTYFGLFNFVVSSLACTAFERTVKLYALLVLYLCIYRFLEVEICWHTARIA
jgi:hypothetical protein